VLAAYNASVTGEDQLVLFELPRVCRWGHDQSVFGKRYANGPNSWALFRNVCTECQRLAKEGREPLYETAHSSRSPFGWMGPGSWCWCAARAEGVAPRAARLGAARAAVRGLVYIGNTG
jgi:hypothetical protein